MKKYSELRNIVIQFGQNGATASNWEFRRLLMDLKRWCRADYEAVVEAITKGQVDFITKGGKPLRRRQ